MNLLITAVFSATDPLETCKHACNLVRCAASRKEMFLITLAIGKWQESYFRTSLNLEAAKLRIVAVDIADDAFTRNLWYLRGLPKLVDDTAADIVHLSFPAPIRRSMLRCPVVLSLHDLQPYDEPGNFGFPKMFFNRVFLQRLLNEVDSVVCVSEATLGKLKARSPRLAQKKSVVIYSCVTIGAYEPIAPVGEQYRFVFMVAWHGTSKNITLALRVFEELLQKEIINKQTVLLIVGSRGPETTALIAFIEQRGLDKSVRLVEKVTDGELRWLYTNCDFLIAPSSIEGCGLPVAEGLVCGSRIVCSDIPAFREIGGDTCHYFDLHAQSDSSAMIAAICSALAEPARPARRIERFSLEHIASEYAALYVQLREDG
jgi:glycosyltransferase involved in cell wall biosynthesis